MSDAVSVTIGIPFFNARSTLADALRSVFAQTYGDWELILVDDGSTDGSGEVARALRDPRVRLIADGVNRGLSHRLNQIADLARGKYLARMDADDLMHPERLERQVSFLDMNPRVDLLDTATWTIDANNEPLGVRGDRPLNCDVRAVLKSGLLIHPTVLGRTSWFRANRYDGLFVRAEDQELWLRSCRATVFGRLQEPLFFYRESLAGNLGNYLRTEQTLRTILRLYGPAAVGHLRTALLVARSHAKSWLYQAYTRVGQQGRLIRARTRTRDAAAMALARAAIRAVLQTPLPTCAGDDHDRAPGADSCAASASAARLHGAADVELSAPPCGVRAQSGL